MKFITTVKNIENIPALAEHGASAVLLSIPFFSTRTDSHIEEHELRKAKEICEEQKIEMFVQINRLFVEEELKELNRILHILQELSIDGIYFGDEAVLWQAQQLGMEECLIYNPDTLVTNHFDAMYYIEEGCRMVSLSKELTLEEMLEIGQKSKVNRWEVIIHGRLNMFHSKRLLLKNYMDFLGKKEDLKNRSDLMLKEEKREEMMPVIEDDLGTNIYTGFTLSSFEELSSLQSAGFEWVRIDGIFQELEWVLEALDLYQEVLDGGDGKTIYEKYCNAYPELNVSKGFWYTNTILAK